MKKLLEWFFSILYYSFFFLYILLFFVILVDIVMAGPVQGFMRCDGKLINIDTTITELIQHCQQPINKTFTGTNSQPVKDHTGKTVTITVPVFLWVYDKSISHYTVLTITGGSITNIEYQRK